MAKGYTHYRALFRGPQVRK